MKKIVSLLLVVLCLGAMVALSGCGEKNEFTQVYSVSYEKNDGSTDTVYSYVDLEVSDREAINGQEHADFIGITINAVQYSQKNVVQIKIDREKSNIPAVKINDDIIFFYANIYTPYKAKVKSVNFNYVSTKTVSDKEILIKTNQGTDRIISSYIKIEYFN